METHEAASRPTPEEASAALREAEQAKATLTGIAPPWWYFATMAALLAVAPVVVYAPETALGITLVLVGIVVWALIMGVAVGLYVRRAGVVPRLSAVPKRFASVVLTVALAMAVTAAVVAAVSDQRWVWFIASGTGAVLVLVLGAVVRRAARQAA
jgi:hypothetical protein